MCGCHKNFGSKGPSGHRHQRGLQREQDRGACPHRPPELRPWPGVLPDAGRQTNGLWVRRTVCSIAISSSPSNLERSRRNRYWRSPGEFTQEHLPGHETVIGVHADKGAYPRPLGSQFRQRRYRREVPWRCQSCYRQIWVILNRRAWSMACQSS